MSPLRRIGVPRLAKIFVGSLLATLLAIVIFADKRDQQAQMNFSGQQNNFNGRDLTLDCAMHTATYTCSNSPNGTLTYVSGTCPVGCTSYPSGTPWACASDGPLQIPCLSVQCATAGQTCLRINPGPAETCCAGLFCTPTGGQGIGSTCTSCGNGTVEAGEQCDDGANNGDTKPCTATCQKATCGDDKTCSDPTCGTKYNTVLEECDLGIVGDLSNGGPNSGCSAQCKGEDRIVYCCGYGDGEQDPKTCVTDQNCAAGRTCSEGFCVINAVCLEDADCQDPAFVCLNVGGGMKCVPSCIDDPATAQDECTGNSSDPECDGTLDKFDVAGSPCVSGVSHLTLNACTAACVAGNGFDTGDGGNTFSIAGPPPPPPPPPPTTGATGNLGAISNIGNTGDIGTFADTPPPPPPPPVNPPPPPPPGTCPSGTFLFPPEEGGLTDAESCSDLCSAGLFPNSMVCMDTGETAQWGRCMACVPNPNPPPPPPPPPPPAASASSSKKPTVGPPPPPPTPPPPGSGGSRASVSGGSGGSGGSAGISSSRSSSRSGAASSSRSSSRQSASAGGASSRRSGEGMSSLRSSIAPPPPGASSSRTSLNPPPPPPPGASSRPSSNGGQSSSRASSVIVGTSSVSGGNKSSSRPVAGSSAGTVSGASSGDIFASSSRRACVDNSDCPSGLPCVWGVCQNASASSSRRACVDNSDCPSGIACVWGVCQNASASSRRACVDNSDCPSGLPCVWGVCMQASQPAVIVEPESSRPFGLDGRSSPAAGFPASETPYAFDLVSCGDGVVQAGEECDDGNVRHQDGCSAQCLLEFGRCGDGIVQSLLNEQCEPGAPSAMPCRSDCRYALLSCGDGRVDAGETCDLGAANADTPTATCRTDCSVARCGDRIVDTREQCDDGNRLFGDGCDASCRTERGAPSETLPANIMDVALPWAQGSAVQGTLVCNVATDCPAGSVCAAGLCVATPSRAPAGSTGPAAAVLLCAAGASAGLAWMRRRKDV